MNLDAFTRRTCVPRKKTHAPATSDLSLDDFVTTTDRMGIGDQRNASNLPTFESACTVQVEYQVVFWCFREESPTRGHTFAATALTEALHGF